ncbi:hypothetical protein IW261DRAFT_1422408 [Armillaria novae-zelandiae]|uniref:Uncharacterized protein n=1 Tax=Armillaria novae-zelandiae TaxID=153914 RepID=A0AA39U625_9AGAR|nr:hypothetical protein IW261DRAFT_1422408 [Armillaria novae-zelandiae]
MYYHSVSPIIVDLLLRLPNLYKLNLDRTGLESTAEYMDPRLQSVQVFGLIGAQLPNISTLPTVIFLLPNREIPSPRTILLGVTDAYTLSELLCNLTSPNPGAKLDKVRALQTRISRCVSVQDRWDIERLLILTRHALEHPLGVLSHSMLRTSCLRMPLNASVAPSESHTEALPDSLATLPQTIVLVLLSLTQHTGDALVQNNSQ